MNQANIGLLGLWKSIPGNANSDLPVGWNGPGGSPSNPNTGSNVSGDTAALAASQKAATDARFASNKADLGDFNTRFSAAAPKIISDTSAKYNLGALLDQANGLNSRVSELSGNTNNEGAGGYASGQQVDRAIQSNYLPRAQQAVTNLQTGTTLAQAEESQLFKPYEIESNLLNERLARETAGYTAEQQRELDGLVEKMKAGVALTTAEIAQATALAQAEKNYQGVLATANASMFNANTAQKYQNVKAGDSLVNTYTGGVLRAR